MQTILKNGCAEAIVDTLGGELVSYKNNGKEYIWIGDAAHWSGHAPVLFPFVSALKEGKLEIDGKSYTMKGKHGFARKSEFVLVESSENKAVFELAYNDTTQAMYPYKFKLFATHEICPCGFKTTYQVQNMDDKAIQFCIGAHPGFLVENSVEDYKLVFEKAENIDLFYTDADSLFNDSYKIPKRIRSNEFELCYDDFDVDAIVAKDIESRKVKLIHKETGKGMEFDYQGYSVLVLWTPPKKKSPFLCLEPWNGLPAYTDESGKLSDKPYVITLEVGKTYEVGYKMNVIE